MFRFIIIITFVIVMFEKAVAQVSINDTGNNANTNSILDVDASTNNKGVRLPSLTTTERITFGSTIAITEESMLVYDTDLSSYWYWDGSNWKQIIADDDYDWEIIGNEIFSGHGGNYPTKIGIGLLTTFSGSLPYTLNIGGTAGIAENYLYLINNVGFSVGRPSVEYEGAAIAYNYSDGLREVNLFNVDTNTSTPTNNGFTFSQMNTNSTHTNLLRIQGDGKVGIGTSTPGKMLHINDTNYLGGIGLKYQNSIWFKDQADTDWIRGITVHGVFGAINDIHIGSGSNPVETDISFDIGGTHQSAMFINGETGYIGMHNTSPLVPLSIYAHPDTAVNGIISLKTDGFLSFRIKLSQTFDGYTNTDGIAYYEIGGNEAHMFGGEVIPDVDAGRSLGNASKRWSAVYSANGTIQTSDIRQKKEIKPLNYGIKELMLINPISFKWKDKNIGNSTKLGFSAQELLQIIPEVINVADNKEKTLSVFYSDIIPVVVNATKEQQKEIEDLKNKNKELNNRINKLEKLIIELSNQIKK